MSQGATASPPPLTPSLLPPIPISSTMGISASNYFPPPRPKNGYGTVGRVIPLRLNYFPIQIPHLTIQMYHIDVFNDSLKSEDKSVTQKFICKAVINSLLRNFQSDFPGEKPVYDGQAILYTKKPLWGNTTTREYKNVDWLDTENGDKKRSHRVVFTHVATIDLSMIQEFIDRNKPYLTAVDRQEDFDRGRTAIQAIEVIMRQLPQSKHVTVGRNFYFDPGQNPPNLGEGCDIWEGYFQSLRPGQWKPFINIDTAVAGMMKDMNLIDFICDAVNVQNPREAMRKINVLQRVLCNLKVATKHLGFRRVYKINNSAKKVFGKEASSVKFKPGEGPDTTIEKYFMQKYKIKLDFPDLPCVLVGNKGTAIPMELCTVVKGQHKIGKLTGDQTANIIRYAAKPAFDKEKVIQQIASREIVIKDPLLAHYGIQPSNRMIEVEGRVLDTPIINYNNKTLNPRDGSWNLMGVVFSNGKSMDSWGIIDFVGLHRDKCDHFIYELQDVGGNSGMRIQKPLFINAPRINAREDEFRKKELIRKELESVYRSNSRLQMIVVFINAKPFPLENREMYGHIKRVCDSELGINSQCIKDKNLFKVSKSVIANICLKMNAKLGGINHIVEMSRTPSAELFKRPIMFLGADVAHPGPGTDQFTPSIAAMVGSLDSKLAKYLSCVRFQKHSRSIVDKIVSNQPLKRKERLEMIDKFEEMAYEILLGFQQFCKGHLPERIIYYRDGVSEGQFIQVLDWELKALRKACKRFHADNPGYEPAITLVCVQKRQHLRMFCADRRDQVGRGGNVPPGTCVDREVTHNLEFDFFLCSHFGLQGTSRPSHYHVLWDENSFDANSLQALTYQLCHTYARCTKAVSLPAPVYYAHWVAKRAAMSATFREDDSSSVSSGSSGDLEKWDQMRKPMLIEKGLMYWA
ncbi:argonaute 2 [Oopsacas minuta]|uniref:Argonaute 2 n=1 Tax=Oopsacas minuta TaxID=111878 RepID=A0A1W5RS65_9METZ|nr:argonaute 2 [Oopsacas minuta]KAI6658442.1 argonaute 2 [Oopsacas minuta]